MVVEAFFPFCTLMQIRYVGRSGAFGGNMEFMFGAWLGNEMHACRASWSADIRQGRARPWGC